MKKFLILALIFNAVISTSLLAQDRQAAIQPKAKEGVQPQATAPTATTPPGADAEAMLQKAKEVQKPLMMEKTGLTEAQADRVIEINFEIRQAAGDLRGLSEADRSARIAELKALKERKYSEIPLTAEQIKSVYAFYEDLGKSMPQKRGS